MATRVTINKALEAQLREWYESKRMDTDGHGYIGKIIKLLDDEQGKRAATSNTEPKTGLGYKEIVALLRSFLGSELITPPKPSTPHIVKIVNKAKEQGLDYGTVETVVTGLRRTRGGPYRLADIIYNIDILYATGAATRNNTEIGDSDTRNVQGDRNTVYTGRPSETETEDG